MSLFLQVVVAIGIAIAAFALVVGATELGRIRTILDRGRIRVENIRAHTTSSSNLWINSRSGYAVYVFQQGSWVLEADFSRPGYEPVPPTIEAAFDGQVVKKESGLKKGA